MLTPTSYALVHVKCSCATRSSVTEWCKLGVYSQNPLPNHKQPHRSIYMPGLFPRHMDYWTIQEGQEAAHTIHTQLSSATFDPSTQVTQLLRILKAGGPLFAAKYSSIVWWVAVDERPHILGIIHMYMASCVCILFEVWPIISQRFTACGCETP